jgi:hypothetical protein
LGGCLFGAAPAANAAQLTGFSVSLEVSAMRLYLLSLALTMSFVECATAGCPGGACGGSSPSMSMFTPQYLPQLVSAGSSCTWKIVPGHPRQRALFCGDTQCGNLDIDSGKWWSYNTSTGDFDEPIFPWGVQKSTGCTDGSCTVPAKKFCRCKDPNCSHCPNCKCDCKDPDCTCHKKSGDKPDQSNTDPFQPAELAADWRTNGVMIEKLSPEPKVAVNGEPATPIQALSELSVPTDENQYRITVIGETNSDYEPVLKFIADQGLDDKYVVKGYTKGQWAVADFHADGNPTVLIQTPDGKVVHRQNSGDLQTLQKALASLVRKPNPHYDPKKDPDLSRSPLTDDGDDLLYPVLAGVVTLGGGGFAIVALLLGLVVVRKALT